MSTRLIVTIDTEEEGLWGGAFRRLGNTVANVHGVGRFQAHCDAAGIVPTYLVDTPVVEDDGAVRILRALQDSGRAEIGAHLHPWCAPPFEEDVNACNSYLCNLDARLQREKLAHLTDHIEKRFGRRPTSFRAGRYGLDIVGARVLAELGYVVDSSVIPFSDFSSEGGPRFEEAPHQPYFIAGDELCRPSAEGFLVEVPVAVGFSRPDFVAAARWRRWALQPFWKRLKAVGMVDRLGLARRIKFSPEQADVRSLRQLVDAFLQQQAPCMVMMFHSSSLLAGMSPYVRDEQALNRFHDVLAETFDYCCRARGMVPSTLTAFAESFKAGLSGAACAAANRFGAVPISSD